MRKKEKIKEQKSLKNSKGITLIALVITIIVLLILAGVSIATLSGDNGVLTKASDAKVVNEMGALKDEIVLKATEGMSDYYEDVYVSNTGESAYDRSKLVETIMKKIAKEYVGNEAGGTKEYGTYTVTISGTGAGAKITIQSKTKSSLKTVGTMQDDGKIIWDDNYTSKTSENPPAGDTIQAGETATGGNKKYIADGKTAIIPENFTVSSTESSINNGLVVIGPDGSEFVWIPIDKDTLNPIGASGVLTNKEMAEQVDGKWRGILYDFTGSGTNITSIKYNSTGFREPAYLAGQSYGDANTSKNTIGVSQNSLQDEYDAIIGSIKANGGFYVGRYESSLDGSNKIQSKRGTNIKPASASIDSLNDWYGLYAKQKTYAGTTITGTSIKSTMITGACYDAMLNWALKSGSDSAKVMEKTNGNHSRSVEACGSTANDKINNIYDLEGNVREWTSEANNPYCRVTRGGDYRFKYSPRHRDNYIPTFSVANYGSRLLLYM